MSDKNQSNDNKMPPVFCVIMHSPGPSWQAGVPFQEQPGVGEHVKYMRQQFNEGKMIIGGPFLDNSGGMMVCKTPDIELAKQIAEADPTVISGLLKVEIKRWMVPMSSVDISASNED